MPRHPAVAPRIAALGGSVYSTLAHRLAAHRGPTYPLHVGDTWMEPAEGCRVEDLRVADHPGLHRYAPPQGLPALLDALVEHTERRQGVPTERAEILITAGATGGLSALAGALLRPGDEVLILAPYWPLIAGIVRSLGGVPVAVPFHGAARDARSAAAAARAHLSDRTVALYLNTPSNPTGRLIPGDWLEALVHLARAHDLWIIADEVYEHFAWGGPHVYTRPLAPERTFSTHSFSKAYGMAGNRLGYLVGPAVAMEQVRKLSTHTIYAAPTASQVAATRALAGPGERWAEAAARGYAEVGREAAARLGLPAPEGCTFLFPDVAPHLRGRGVTELLSECVDRGLLVAPGSSFGPYPTHLRICFTAAPPAEALAGVEILAEVLGL